MSEVFKNYIDGKWLPAQAGQVIENRNPANRNDLVGLFPASDQGDVDTAVAAAKKAFASWRLVPAPKRGELLYRVGELLKAHKEEIARDHDPRDGQGLERNSRRRAGRHRHCFLYGRRRPAAFRRNDAIGDARQVRHVGARASRRLRIDHAMEFSDGDPNMEDVSGADLRQHRGAQAGGRYAAYRRSAF